MVGGNKGGDSRWGMERVMDIAYGIGATILSGKMVRRHKLKMGTQVLTIAIKRARFPC